MILKIIFKPLLVIFKFPVLFFLWLIFVVTFSMIGIIASLAININVPYGVWLEGILKTGSFYSIGIALCAASVFVILTELALWALAKSSEEPKFMQHKLVALGLSVLIIVFMAISYAVLLNLNPNVLPNPVDVVKKYNEMQIILFAVAMLLSFYMFCICYLDKDYESFKDIDDRTILLLKKKADSLKDDGKGTKL